MKPIRLEILCHAPPGFRKTARLPEIAADILNNHPAWQALGLRSTSVRIVVEDNRKRTGKKTTP